MKRLLVLAALLFVLPAHAEVTFDWVEVGDPGNACDTQSEGCFGAVAYTYQIGKYEVTNAQYAEFLNAVAATDTYGLYNTNMGVVAPYFGGITRSGSPGSYTYSAIAGREDMPVNWVSFYDALRFANWLHNGQPTGAQDSSTTEDGAYDMSLGSSVVRKAGAQVFLTIEDEWYKAAYYDTALEIYYDYPAGTDTQTTCTVPGATANTANCDLAVGDLTDVGSYTGSASPNGTFDQGGNVWEWNDAIRDTGRVLRGGGFNSGLDDLVASGRDDDAPAVEGDDFGFRVASPSGDVNYLEISLVKDLVGTAYEYDILFDVNKGGATTCTLQTLTDPWGSECPFGLPDGDPAQSIRTGLTCEELAAEIGEDSDIDWTLTWDVGEVTETVAEIDFGTINFGTISVVCDDEDGTTDWPGELPAISSPQDGETGVSPDTSIDWTWWPDSPDPSSEGSGVLLLGPNSEQRDSDDLTGDATSWTPLSPLDPGEWVAIVMNADDDLRDVPVGLTITGDPWELDNSGWLTTATRDVSSFTVACAVPSLNPTGAAMLGGLVFGIGVVGLVVAARRRRG